MTRRTLALLPIVAMLPMATPCQNGKKLTACKTCQHLDRSRFHPGAAHICPEDRDKDVSTAYQMCMERTPNHDALCLAPGASVIHKQRDFDWYEGTEKITEETVHPLASSINDGNCKYWEPIKKGGN